MVPLLPEDRFRPDHHDEADQACVCVCVCEREREFVCEREREWDGEREKGREGEAGTECPRDAC